MAQPDTEVFKSWIRRWRISDLERNKQKSRCFHIQKSRDLLFLEVLWIHSGGPNEDQPDNKQEPFPAFEEQWIRCRSKFVKETAVILFVIISWNERQSLEFFGWRCISQTWHTWRNNLISSQIQLFIGHALYSSVLGAARRGNCWFWKSGEPARLATFTATVLRGDCNPLAVSIPGMDSVFVVAESGGAALVMGLK